MLDPNYSYAFLSESVSLANHNDDLLLTLQRNSTAIRSVATTSNQVAVASALDQISQGQGQGSGGGHGSALMGSVLSLTKSQASGAFDQLSGELHADLSTIQIRSAQLFSDALSQQMQLAHGGSESPPVIAT